MFMPFAITGVGIVSAYGSGVSPFITGIRDKVSGLDRIMGETTDIMEDEIAGKIKSFDPKQSIGLSRTRMYDRLTLILMDAVEELLRSTGLKEGTESWKNFSPEEVGAVVATTGSISTMTTIDLQTIEDARYIVPSDFPNAVICAQIGHVAIRHGFKAFNYTITNGMTGSADAFLLTATMLNARRARIIIAGGAEELSVPYSIMMKASGMHNKREVCPLGEGAAVFTCEPLDSAAERNADEYGIVCSVISCFENEPSKALKKNLLAAKSLLGRDYSKICHVYVSGIEDGCADELGLDASFYDTTSLYGNVNNGSTAFKVAAALANPEIDCQKIILINDYETNGQFTTTVLKKLRCLEFGS